MDSLTHFTQKIMIERARQGLQPQASDPIPETAPPPYTPSEDNNNDDDSDSDSDSDEELDDPPIKLTINAANSIQGSNNLVPTSPSPLADATKFSALLLHAVNRINAAGSGSRSKGRVNVDLTINCGVTIVGDRNVVGNVGLKAKSPGALPQRAAAGGEERDVSAGAKRGVDDVSASLYQAPTTL